MAMYAARIRPARTKRTPAVRSGGIDWTTSAMAKYVDPQTTYTVRSASQTIRIQRIGYSPRENASYLTVISQYTPKSSIHVAPSMSGRRYSLYVPGAAGAFTVNWNHAT